MSEDHKPGEFEDGSVLSEEEFQESLMVEGQEGYMNLRWFRNGTDGQIRRGSELHCAVGFHQKWRCSDGLVLAQAIERARINGMPGYISMTTLPVLTSCSAV